MRLSLPVLLIGASMLLPGCASQAPAFEGQPALYGPARERQIFHALTRLKVDDAQRVAVLSAFDDADPKLKGIAQKDADGQAQLKALDVHRPDYLDRVAPLAQQHAQLASERLLVEAQFNKTVASTLSESQWQAWSELFRSRNIEPDDGQEQADGGNHGGGGRRRGGGQRGA